MREKHNLSVDNGGIEQFNGREGETATFLSRCLLNSNGLGGGFAPRHLKRSALSGEMRWLDFMKLEIPTPTIVTASIGRTDSQVVAEVDGRAVYSHRFPVGTQTFGEAVIEHFRQNLNLLIGERTAEAITIAVGRAFPEDDDFRWKCVDATWTQEFREP